MGIVFGFFPDDLFRWFRQYQQMIGPYLREVERHRIMFDQSVGPVLREVERHRKMLGPMLQEAERHRRMFDQSVGPMLREVERHRTMLGPMLREANRLLERYGNVVTLADFAQASTLLSQIDFATLEERLRGLSSVRAEDWAEDIAGISELMDSPEFQDLPLPRRVC